MDSCFVSTLQIAPSRQQQPFMESDFPGNDGREVRTICMMKFQFTHLMLRNIVCECVEVNQIERDLIGEMHVVNVNAR